MTRKNAQKLTNNGQTVQEQKPASLDAGKILKEYFDILNYQTLQRNHLLGKFDNKNKYVLDDEKIIAELIAYPKKFESKDENTIYLASKIGKVVLNFKIELDLDPSYCTAKLYIIEIEQNLDESIKHVTKLDEFVEPYSPLFKDHAYKEWKVYFDEEVYDKNDFLDKFFHDQEEEFLFNKELTEVLSQLYLMRILKLLNNGDELFEKVLVDYRLMVEKYTKDHPELLQDQTFLKLILDKSIAKHNALPELLKSTEGAQVLSGYYMPIKKIKEKSVPTIISPHVEAKVEEKKSEKKEEKKADNKKKDNKKKDNKGKDKKKKKKNNKKKDGDGFSIGDFYKPAKLSPIPERYTFDKSSVKKEKKKDRLQHVKLPPKPKQNNFDEACWEQIENVGEEIVDKKENELNEVNKTASFDENLNVKIETDVKQQEKPVGDVLGELNKKEKDNSQKFKDLFELEL